MRRKATAALAVVSALAAVAQAARPAPTHWRISTLSGHSYAEPGISAHRRTLLIDAASANTGAPPTFWISRDGGGDWSAARDFDATGSATGDADALVGPDGYLYGLNLGYNRDPHKAPDTRVLVFRSRNGRSWRGPAAFPTHGLDEPDRPWLAVNPHRPANVDVVYAQGGGRIYMWRSMDHGAKFAGPIPVSAGHPAVALSSRPLFDPSRAGRLFMLYETTGSARIRVPARGAVYEIPLSQIWLATSRDGGRTWSNRRVLASRNSIIGHSLVASAIDRRGALYAAFSARRTGSTRTTIYLMHSTTHGRSWSAPDRVGSPMASNVMPALALTSHGTVYLSWYGSPSTDFRSRHAAWREMFAREPAGQTRFRVTQVSGRRPVHLGAVNSAGALGSDTGANWGLRDFQGVAVGPCGAPVLAWADDNRMKATQVGIGACADSGVGACTDPTAGCMHPAGPARMRAGRPYLLP